MQNASLWGETLRLLVELAATAAFALSGILEGARRRLDAVGVVVVGFLAAFGGGTLRDLLLDQRPFFWVRHVELLWGVLALSVLVLGGFGMAYSLYPYVLLDQLTVWQVASAPESLKIILVGTAISLPAIAGYTVFVYRVFGGKTSELSYG